MLIVRNEQLAFFSLQHSADFVERLLPHLAANYPHWYEENRDQGARAFAERVIELGNKCGIRGRSAVGTLVELCIEFGEGFERSPDRDWARSITAHAALPEQLKVSMLGERLRARTHGRRIVEIEAGEAG